MTDADTEVIGASGSVINQKGLQNGTTTGPNVMSTSQLSNVIDEIEFIDVGCVVTGCNNPLYNSSRRSSAKPNHSTAAATHNNEHVHGQESEVEHEQESEHEMHESDVESREPSRSSSIKRSGSKGKLSRIGSSGKSNKK